MKKIASIILFFLFVFSSNIFSQENFTLEIDQTELTDTVGNEIVFYFEITNTSGHPLTIYMLRTQNDLPENWTSSMCIDLCYPPTFDSIATSSDFASTPIQPGEHRELSVHVFTMENEGTAFVDINIGNVDQPSENLSYNLIANATITDVNDEINNPLSYNLEQNYPNPFNPSTKIKYSVAKTGKVNLSVYDILGSKIATLVNEVKSPGNYEVDFSSSKMLSKNLSSGIYFYKLITNNFVQTKKMILEK